MPQVIEINDNTGPPLGMLVRISFPDVAYLVPLIPYVAANRIPRNLTGWNVIASGGMKAAAAETIEWTLVRVRMP